MHLCLDDDGQCSGVLTGRQRAGESAGERQHRSKAKSGQAFLCNQHHASELGNVLLQPKRRSEYQRRAPHTLHVIGICLFSEEGR